MVENLDFQTAEERFIKWLTVQNYSSETIKTNRYALKCFGRFFQTRGKKDVRGLTHEDIVLYQKEVEDKKEWSPGTQQIVLARLRLFLKYLTSHHPIMDDLTSVIRLKKKPYRIPSILSEREMTKLLNAPYVGHIGGLRDRAIIELFYSSGLRVAEVMRLKVTDVDLKKGEIFVREGKGRKDRVVPLGREAIFWIDKYLRESRPQFEAKRQGGFSKGKCEKTLPLEVFLTQWGGRFKDRQSIEDLLRRHRKTAGLAKSVYPHLLRHTMATHLLENGAPFPMVSMILGHKSLSTTSVYTHVAVKELKDMVEKYHPRGVWKWDILSPSSLGPHGEKRCS
jgi:integrase/recombinase XerD